MGWSLAHGQYERTARCHAGSRTIDQRLLVELAHIDRVFAQNRTRISEQVYGARVAVRLNPGQAHYSETLGRLYFVDYRDRSIENSLRAVFAGLGLDFESILISTDIHGFFTNGYRVSVPGGLTVPVFTALRLLGVRIGV
ncbi:MAG: hypothetical protein OES09_18315 [Gammaproteobacteria bacterium]|nr:hypothetical protein [Gammaproteobacteria bacterium]